MEDSEGDSHFAKAKVWHGKRTEGLDGFHASTMSRDERRKRTCRARERAIIERKDEEKGRKGWKAGRYGRRDRYRMERYGRSSRLGRMLCSGVEGG
jgi:hypothetical protein